MTTSDPMFEDDFVASCWYRLNSEQKQEVSTAWHELDHARKKLAELDEAIATNDEIIARQKHVLTERIDENKRLKAELAQYRNMQPRLL